jgi:hypothetical protein
VYSPDLNGYFQRNISPNFNYIYIYIRDIRVILAEYKVPYIAATDTLSITASSIMNAYRRRGKKKRERERERKKAGGN